MKKITIAVVTIGIMNLFVYLNLNKINKPSQTTTNTEPIKIGVIAYPDNGIFYLAQENGFFQKYGVNVELIQVSADDSFSALGANKIQMVTSYSPDTMTIVADAGTAAKQILVTSISDGADGLLTTKNIQKLADLKGKDVYLTYGYPEHFFFRYLAEKNGLSFDDVRLVNMASEEIGSSFATEKINAGMTWEPWLSKAVQERKDGKLLVTSHDVPGVIMTVLVARNDVIENRRDDVKNIMRAILDASDWWNKNLNEGNIITAKNLKLTVDEFAPMKKRVQLADFQANLKIFNKTSPLNIYEVVNKAADYYLHDGVIKTKITAESATDSSLLNEIR